MPFGCWKRACHVFLPAFLMPYESQTGQTPLKSCTTWAMLRVFANFGDVWIGPYADDNTTRRSTINISQVDFKFHHFHNDVLLKCFMQHTPIWSYHRMSDQGDVTVDAHACFVCFKVSVHVTPNHHRQANTIANVLQIVGTLTLLAAAPSTSKSPQ